MDHEKNYYVVTVNYLYIHYPVAGAAAKNGKAGIVLPGSFVHFYFNPIMDLLLVKTFFVPDLFFKWLAAFV